MSDQTIFAVMIFVIVLLLTQAFVAPMMGSRRAGRKRLKERIRNLGESRGGESHASLIRRRQMQKLSPFGRWIESLPIMERLRTLIEQAGFDYPAYRVVILSFMLFLLAGIASQLYTRSLSTSLLVAAVAAVLPFLRLRRKRQQRLQKFEEQLPDALSVAARSLKAGLPFSEALNMVAKEMQEPISSEFERVFTELNYGGDLRSALFGLLERMSSVAVMAVVTAVLIQRETGGNLAEVLERISKLVRERFRFQRSIRALTAEGRGTAWVVALMPFGLAILTETLQPGWVTGLVADPMGKQLMIAAFILVVIGILWLRKMVNIDV